jgi:hypothetical protein
MRSRTKKGQLTQKLSPLDQLVLQLIQHGATALGGLWRIGQTILLLYACTFVCKALKAFKNKKSIKVENVFGEYHMMHKILDEF